MKQPLRVLHVNDVAYTGSNLVRGLHELGVEARLFQAKIGTYRASPASRLILPFTRTQESFQLRRFVRANHIDLLHIHYAAFAYMALITGLPFILHCHGGDMDRDIFIPGLRQVILLGLRKAQAVFCSTPNMIAAIKPYRPDVIFLPSPVDTQLFMPEPKAAADQCHLLSISKLDRKKGIARVIATIEYIWQLKPGTRIGIFNFGSEQPKYSDFFSKNQDRMTVLPRTEHNKMPDLINSYQVILGQQDFARRAMGVSELEAMACAKPVSCLFSYPDSYPSPPPLVSSATPEEAAANISNLFDDEPSLVQKGMQSREWVIENHSIARISKKLLENYEVILQHQNG